MFNNIKIIILVSFKRESIRFILWDFLEQIKGMKCIRMKLITRAKINLDISNMIY